jgi:hypothetical protein
MYFSLPAGRQGIGWPFFGDFFWPPKKSYNRKNGAKGKFRSTEMILTFVCLLLAKKH